MTVESIETFKARASPQSFCPASTLRQARQVSSSHSIQIQKYCKKSQNTDKAVATSEKAKAITKVSHARKCNIAGPPMMY